MTNDLRYKGDDFGAFGGDFLTITITNNTGEKVKSVAVQIGKIQKRNDIEILPAETKTFGITLSAEESKQLMISDNEIYAACYDELNRKLTCLRLGDISFNTNSEVVKDGRNCC